MQNIQISTGVQTYTFNEGCTLTFNPTDSGFVKRLYAALDMLRSRHEEYTASIGEKEGTAAVFDEAEKLDADTRGIIDGLFGKPVCAELFGDMNVCALADGLPLWMNLLLTVVDLIDEKTAAETQSVNPRLEKYLAKYRAKKKANVKK